MPINVTSEFGIIIRRRALVERGVSVDDIVSLMESAPLDINEDLISFGPSFGQEALDTLIRRLMSAGLEYFDDFFEFSGIFPPWCHFKASIN